MRAEAEVSVVMTVFNEAGNIGDLLDALLEGTVRPAEIVVADGGSSDATVDIVRARSVREPSINIIEDAGDRSSGRNAAIAAAVHERIVAIDAGCLPRADWLEHMVGAFDRGAKWVGGFYEPVAENQLGRAIGLTMVYVREEAESHFVPSARSLGFTRALWEEVGGFPSGVQFAEDTMFAEELFRRGYEPRFVPQAVVEWHPPATLRQQARTMFNWGRGDGLLGLRQRHYLRLGLGTAATAAGAVALALVDPRLSPVALVPGVVYAARTNRFKFRHMTGWGKWVLIPLAAVNGSLATLAGFLVGRWRRMRS